MAKPSVRKHRWKSKWRVLNARLGVSTCPQYGVTDDLVKVKTWLESVFQEDVPDDVSGTDFKSGRNSETFRLRRV